MRKSVELDLPVWLPWAMRKAPVDFSTTSIRKVSAEDAPVALRYHELHGFGMRETTEYRLFDGKLWQLAGSDVRTNRSGRPYENPRGFDAEWDGMDVAKLRRRLKSMQAYAAGEGDAPHGRIYEDVRNAFQRPLGTGVLMNSKHQVLDDRGRAAVAAETAALAGNAIVMDDRVWRRSKGPVLMAHSGYNITGALLMSRRECEMDEPPNLRASRMDCRDLDRAERLAREAFGNANARRDRFEVEVLLPFAQDDLERESVEIAIWNFYWQVKWQGLSQTAGPAMVQAYLMAKEALAHRWAGVDLEWSPKGHDGLAQHLWNQDAPSPHDLLPVLERIVAASEGSIADNYVRTWRMSLIRGQELVHAMGVEADAARELGSFAL